MDKNATKLESLVRWTIGKTIWHVGTSELAGSTFSLGMGRKLRFRNVPRTNAHDSNAKKRKAILSRVQPEGKLLIWCTWRLDSRRHPLTSSDDIDQVLRSKLKRHLVGKRVSGIEIVRPAYDLRITLAGGLALTIFCDHVPGDPSFDGNWQMRVRNETVAVQPGGVILLSESDYWEVPSTRKAGAVSSRRRPTD